MPGQRQTSSKLMSSYADRREIVLLDHHATIGLKEA